MNAETMTINPNELVIDLPVDDAHVQELMNSLQKNRRMVEPVTVWLQGMRIINGFHRTEAAKRLGWESMPCLIQDLTEDEFWDARIIAAKPHKEVESARLAAWMLESWRNTWGLYAIDTSTLGEMLDRVGVTESPTDERLHLMALIDALDAYKPDDGWARMVFAGTEKEHVGFTKLGRKRFVQRKIWEKRNPTEFEQWFEQKASKWGVSVNVVVNSIEKMAKEVLGIEYALSSDRYIIHAADEWRSSDEPLPRFIAKKEAQRHHPDYPRQWIEDALDGKATLAQITEYRTKAERERKEQEQREIDEERRRQERQKAEHVEAEHRRIKEREQDRAALELMSSSPKYRSAALHRFLEQAKFSISSIDTAGLPDAPAMIAEFAQFVADFSAEHFPDVQIASPDPVALENSRLRAENARLKERIASLERALGSKQAAGEMLSSAIAWSSGDLER